MSPSHRGGGRAVLALAATLFALTLPSLVVLLVLAQSAAAAAPAQPPAVTVLKASPRASAGSIFVAPKFVGTVGGAGPQGPEILDGQGRTVWFDQVPADQQATDFRVQRYRGRPVLTWWQGSNHEGPGHGQGIDYIADRHYRVIATVAAGNGYDADSHEFRVTDRGTALITSYHAVPRDLSSVGGPVDGSVYDGIVQEVDVASGRVLLEWHSLDHVPLTDSYAVVAPTPGTPYDYFHINAVNVGEDGDLLVSARHTWTVYDLDRRTGAIRWQLGGKRSDFDLGPGVQFSWQHNALPAGRHTLRIFDNASNGTPTLPASRVIWVRLDRRRHAATLVRSLTHPDGLSAPSQGNAQDLGGGRTFVGWGQLGRFSELDRAGNLLFDAQLAAGYDTYRAYRFAWDGQPLDGPDATLVRSGATATVHASWNGASRVARWLVLGRAHRGWHASVLGQAAWNGLDTAISVPARANVQALVALDGSGHRIGRVAIDADA